MKASLYTRPAKPLRTFASVPKLADLDKGGRPERAPILPPLTVPAELECHVTPPHVARWMANLLPDMEGRDVLEPSAGTGNLLAALATAHPGARVQAVEVYRPLWQRLADAGHCVEWGDFAEWAATTSQRFDGVVMNPPFRKVRAHVQAARALLKPGGVLVALVPVTFDGGEEVQRLPPDTFAAAKVHTKIVTLEG